MIEFYTIPKMKVLKCKNKKKSSFFWLNCNSMLSSDSAEEPNRDEPETMSFFWCSCLCFFMSFAHWLLGYAAQMSDTSLSRSKPTKQFEIWKCYHTGWIITPVALLNGSAVPYQIPPSVY